MKIITWNCNMAYRKKAKFLLALKPDIVIVPECENESKLKFPAGTPQPNDILWIGDNPHKGIGIFSYTGFSFRLYDNYFPGIRYVVPVKVSKGKFSFNLLAVWANNPHDPDGTYVEQVGKAINQYQKLIKKTKTIIAGDFNSNSIWDKEHKQWSHSTVVKALHKKGITSAYHTHHGHQHGQEEHATQFMYRHKNKPYHLDYCFLSEDFMKMMVSAEVGSFKKWIQHSDHLPLIVTLEGLL